MNREGRVYIVDDDAAVRDSLAVLLETQGYAVAGFASAPAFLAAAPALLPGVLVSDVRMPEMDGLELQRCLNERALPFPVIVITGHGDVPLAVRAMKAAPSISSRSRLRARRSSRLSRRRLRALPRRKYPISWRRGQPNGSRPCHRASARCSTASSPACPIRRSPTILRSARARSRSTAPASCRRCRPGAFPNSSVSRSPPASRPARAERGAPAAQNVSPCAPATAPAIVTRLSISSTQ
jgi:CheY-like chemotaxis protein